MGSFSVTCAKDNWKILQSCIVEESIGRGFRSNPE